ncbi:hypothetical protein EZS27_010140 [termite gut metagenome]|uniref:Fimbrillin family protein n=1 Tax=termite gut metagenome TaxID=433724 RepID=A0A5J4S7H1_9ZZZZ
MKSTKFFVGATLAFALATTTLFSSCSNDEVVNNSDRVAVKFASTGVSAQTRIDGVNWIGNDDHIGIYMVQNGSSSVSENAANIEYIANTSGSSTDFSPFDPAQTICYPVDISNKVDFIAYYPYLASVAEEGKYSVDVSNQEGDINLLWAKVDNDAAGYDKTSGNVTLLFTHQLAKLHLTVVGDIGVGSLSGLIVSINGINTEADFDVMTGTWDTGNSPNSISPKEIDNGENYEYEAILLPIETLDTSHTVTFTIASGVYTWELFSNIAKLEAGKKYDYTVTLTKREISILGSIADWTSEGTGTGEAY